MDIDNPDKTTAFWMGVLCAVIFFGVDFVGVPRRGTVAQEALVIILSIVPVTLGIIGMHAIRKNPFFPLVGYTKSDYGNLVKRWACLILGGFAFILPVTVIRALVARAA